MKPLRSYDYKRSNSPFLKIYCPPKVAVLCEKHCKCSHLNVYISLKKYIQYVHELSYKEGKKIF
jgi:hypothetical protein